MLSLFDLTKLFTNRQQLNFDRPIRDIISGAIMAATSVPQLIAYAETVGYAGYRGLSTAGPPLLAWGFATGKFLFSLHILCAF